MELFRGEQYAGWTDPKAWFSLRKREYLAWPRGSPASQKS